MRGKRYRGEHRYLVAPGRRRAMTSGELLAAIGLRPGHPIPPDRDTWHDVLGVKIHVHRKTKRGMEKRVYAVCPVCLRAFEAGHLHQHVEARHP